MNPVAPHVIDTLDAWLRHQMLITEQPGLSMAIATAGQTLVRKQYGHADLVAAERLTSGHVFRVASHSKSFTAAAVMQLRDRGRLRLDDPVGRFVGGLHDRVAGQPLSALLSHSAGLTRDGTDSGQWGLRRPFKSREELLAELANGPAIRPNTRLKYSNHGYALLGMVIEQVTGEDFAGWVARELLKPLGLNRTWPDVPDAARARPPRMASGHSGVWPVGRRLSFDVNRPVGALASAGGFVSTASDLARFFSLLDPDAENPVLSPEARLEMTRPRWPEPDASAGRWYGLGLLTAAPACTPAFGHSGVFPGVLSRTLNHGTLGATISMISNAADGMAPVWLDGAAMILEEGGKGGEPDAALLPWAGVWWSDWVPFLVMPQRGRILVGQASAPMPFTDRSELVPVSGRPGEARIARAPGLGAYGETARLLTDARGRGRELWLGGTRLLPAAGASAALRRRFGD
jgi:D-alanyl-D-alanine carboxypeptidase